MGYDDRFWWGEETAGREGGDGKTAAMQMVTFRWRQDVKEMLHQERKIKTGGGRNCWMDGMGWNIPNRMKRRLGIVRNLAPDFVVFGLLYSRKMGELVDGGDLTKAL